MHSNLTPINSYKEPCFNNSTINHQSFKSNLNIDIKNYFKSNNSNHKTISNNTFLFNNLYKTIIVGHTLPTPSNNLNKDVKKPLKIFQTIRIDRKKNHPQSIDENDVPTKPYRKYGKKVKIIQKPKGRTKFSTFSKTKKFNPEMKCVSDNEWQNIEQELYATATESSKQGNRSFINRILVFLKLNPDADHIHWATFITKEKPISSNATTKKKSNPRHLMWSKNETWIKHNLFNRVGPHLSYDNQQLLIRIGLYTPQ